MVWLSATIGFGADRHEAAEPLTISICIPVTGSVNRHAHASRSLPFGDSHFHVIISNISTNVIRLWDESCSWGYEALSFQFADHAGNHWAVKKGPAFWTSNYPRWWRLDPGESGAIDVDFAQRWEGFRHATNQQPFAVTVSAVYEIRADENTPDSGVWSGKIVSAPLQVDIRK